VIFNLALIVIALAGLLLVLVLIDAVFGNWFKSFGVWED